MGFPLGGSSRREMYFGEVALGCVQISLTFDTLDAHRRVMRGRCPPKALRLTSTRSEDQWPLIRQLLTYVKSCHLPPRGKTNARVRELIAPAARHRARFTSPTEAGISVKLSCFPSFHTKNPSSHTKTQASTQKSEPPHKNPSSHTAPIQKIYCKQIDQQGGKSKKNVLVH